MNKLLFSGSKDAYISYYFKIVKRVVGLTAIIWHGRVKTPFNDSVFSGFALHGKLYGQNVRISIENTL